MNPDDELLNRVYEAMKQYVNVYPYNMGPPSWCIFCHREVDSHVYNPETGKDEFRTPEQLHADDCVFIAVAQRTGRDTYVPSS